MNSDYIQQAPPIASCICDLLDWIEFKALSDNFDTYKLYDLRVLDEELEDKVDDNIGDQDAANEALLDSVYEEIRLRVSSLGRAYPFSLENDDRELVAIEPARRNIGQWVYLYCLIISHPKTDNVLQQDIELIPSDKRRDYLQIASTYAAGGELGNAISFGFPRPDEPNLIKAIHKTFHNRVQEGICLDTAKDGTLSGAKDAGIDVISWKNSPDNLPGKIILYGQVASGLNWQDKSIKDDVEEFYNAFFSDCPKSPYIPAMFIPFCLDGDKATKRANRFNHQTRKFGVIYYRYRLPIFALIGYEKSQDDNIHCHIERSDESHVFKEFVDSFD